MHSCGDFFGEIFRTFKIINFYWTGDSNKSFTADKSHRIQEFNLFDDIENIISRQI